MDHTQTLKDVQNFNWFIISQKCILREGTSKNAVYNSITEAFHCGWSIRRSFFLLFAGASSGVQKSPQDWPRLGLPPGRERAYICPSLTRSCPSLGRFKLMVSPGSVGGSTAYTRFGHNSWFSSPPAHFPNMLPKTDLLELLFRGMEISSDPGLNLRTNPKALDVWLSLSTCVIWVGWT